MFALNKDETHSFLNERHKKLAEKYFSIWKIITQQKRKHQCLENKGKIFDDKLTELIKKLSMDRINKSNSKNNSTLSIDSIETKVTRKCNFGSIFENRLITQKEIIENQKAVIDSQMKVIGELKCKKQMQIASESIVVELEKEYVSKETKMVKTLSRPEEHPLVRRMVEREAERREQRALLGMKRKERERYLAEKAEREAEEKRKEEAARRKEKAKERKEEMRKKEEEERKRQEEELFVGRLRESVKVVAKQLLLNKVVGMWRLGTKLGRVAGEEVKTALETAVVREQLRKWRTSSALTRARLSLIADEVHKRILARSSWSLWIEDWRRCSKMRASLSVWRDVERKRRCFKLWGSYTARNLAVERELELAVNSLRRRCLLAKVFGLWRRAPAVRYQLCERDKRLRDWESKVRSVLPDYNMEILTGQH